MRLQTYGKLGFFYGMIIVVFFDHSPPWFVVKMQFMISLICNLILFFLTYMLLCLMKIAAFDNPFLTKWFRYLNVRIKKNDNGGGCIGLPRIHGLSIISTMFSLKLRSNIWYLMFFNKMKNIGNYISWCLFVCLLAYIP